MADQFQSIQSAIDWLYGLPKELDVYIERMNTAPNLDPRYTAHLNVKGQKLSDVYDGWHVRISRVGTLVGEPFGYYHANPVGCDGETLLEAINGVYGWYCEVYEADESGKT